MSGNLFDLKSDPRELQKLFGQANYAPIQNESARELNSFARALKVPYTDPPERAIDQGR